MAGDWGQLQTQGEEGGIMGKLIWFLFDVKQKLIVIGTNIILYSIPFLTGLF